MHDGSVAGPFGSRLREWRVGRGISQLALAVKVGSTPRHVSFLETGRSRPSRQMVLRLGEALDLPLRQRNLLLTAAGLAAVYPHTSIGAPDLAPYRSAIDRLLRAHLPYPALVVDVHWNVLFANAACAGLYGDLIVGTNVVRRFLTEPAARESIVNWPDVAWAAVERLRHQRDQMPMDAELAELVQLAEWATKELPRPAAAPSEPLVCPWVRVGDQVIKTMGMVARFDAAAEVTLDELRIELTYPLDETADRYFRSLASAYGRADASDTGRSDST